MQIDYAIAGALCLAAHGLVRATEDVEVLISREGLERFKQNWLGRGYVEVRPGGKAVRDTTHRVKVDFLIEGDYPGDGKPKPVRFPAPNAVATDAGFRIVDLPHFVELKLASGMTARHRLQDLADVLRLNAVTKLGREFADWLDPFVRAKVRRALADRSARRRRLLREGLSASRRRSRRTGTGRAAGGT